MAIYWSTPGFKGRTFKLCVLTRWDFNICIHSSPLWVKRGRRTGKLSSASWQNFHSLRHGDQCREDQADDKQHQWHQHRDQSEWTGALDSHKLQIPRLSYNWWGFQAWDTLQDSTDTCSIDKAETSLDWQEYFSLLQDTTDVHSGHIHLPVCLWIMDPHSRVLKKEYKPWK